MSQTALNVTGQRLDSGIGLLYYHARYYDPALARFVSADTIIPGQANKAGTPNPQHLNRYTYGLNNPVKNTDPTGHCIPGIGDCVFTGSLNWGDGAAYATGVVEGAASVVEGVVTAPIAIAQAVSDPAAAVQGLQDQAATVGRGAQFLASDPSGAAAALNNDPRGVGRVLGQAAGTAALAALGGEGGAAGEAEGEAGAAGGACSFSADTLVATDGGEMPIGTLQVGDHVLAYNQAMGITGSYTVTAVLVHPDPVLVQLTLNGEQIETTPEHPFFTQERGWVAAGELRIGEHVPRLHGPDGTVQAWQIVPHAQPMYNLTVVTAHTFFVGEEGWLVHNGDPIRINTQTGKVVDGNGRAYELLRRASDPRSSISPDMDIPYEPYTPWEIPDY
ncbi:MAG: hypothetical protein IPP13_17100 [Kouleothrix sp.]|nr:hypothetical protein [Kouleothrix sp.]